ncbi:MAG TPA: hypothetical protein VGT44_22520 [Ktedonobacteraceae bacterium]|nr:hypothetical protein [Ktedonobacteraceae bacterium]
MLLRSLIQLGGVYRAIQAFHAAREVDLEALKLNEVIVSQPYTPLVTTVVCADYSLTGEWSAAHRYARQTSIIARSDDGVPYTGIPRRLVTEALLRAGDVALAEEYLDLLGQRDGDGRRDRIEYLQACAGLARWQGQLEQALTHLEEARTLAEEIGLPGELWQIEAALADLYQSRGEQVLASQAYIQAAAVVRDLTGTIEDEALRASFLAAAQVRRVMEYGA